MLHTELTIKKITPLGEMDVYDIEVEKDHSYVTKGGFINHNSSKDPNLQNIPVRNDDLDIRKCFIPEENHKLIVCDYCIDENELVLTETGVRRLSSLEVNDFIINEFGEKLRVERKSKKKREQCVELETDHGNKIVLTDLHRLRVLDGDGEVCWKEVGNIDPMSDFLICKTGNPEENIIKEGTTVTVEGKEYPTLLIGMLLGCQIIKGNQDYSLRLPIKNRMTYRFKDSCSLLDSSSRTLEVDNFLYIKGLTSLFLHISKKVNSKGYNEYIPLDILEGNDYYSKIRELLIGFIGVRGYVAGKKYITITGEPPFLNELKVLANVIGLKSTLGVRKFIKKIPVVENGRVISIKKSPYSEPYLRIVGSSLPPEVQELFPSLYLVGTCSMDGLPARRRLLKPGMDKKLRARISHYMYMHSKLKSVDIDAISKHIELDGDEGYYYEQCKTGGIRFEKIKKIEPVGVRNVYDIQVSGNNRFLVGSGIISHNSQIELRLTAYYSGDPEMLRCYNTGIDIHSRTAQASFHLDCDVEDVKTLHKEERSKAKTINFGLIYGMSPYTLSSQLKISLEEAKRAYEGYFRMYKKVRVLMEGIKQKARTVGFVRSVSGRRRRFYELQRLYKIDKSRWTSDDHKKVAALEREAGNFVIQGSGADLMKLAIINIHKKIKPLGARLLMTIHDEVVVSAPKDKVDEVAAIVRDCMENALPKFNKVLPIVAEPVIVDSWAEGK